MAGHEGNLSKTCYIIKASISFAYTPGASDINRSYRDLYIVKYVATRITNKCTIIYILQWMAIHDGIADNVSDTQFSTYNIECSENITSNIVNMSKPNL